MTLSTARNFGTLAMLGSVALLFAVPAGADVKAGVDAWTAGDFAAAIQQWQPAAARGDADAQFNLGQAYRLGRGVPQDMVKAEELFGKAAAQGHPQASDNYGLLLFQRAAVGGGSADTTSSQDREPAVSGVTPGVCRNLAAGWLPAGLNCEWY